MEFTEIFTYEIGDYINKLTPFSLKRKKKRFSKKNTQIVMRKEKFVCIDKSTN